MTNTSRREPATFTECRKIGAPSTVPGRATVLRSSFGAVAAVIPIDALVDAGRAGVRPKVGQSWARAAARAAGRSGAAADFATAVVPPPSPLAPPHPAASAPS